MPEIEDSYWQCGCGAQFYFREQAAIHSMEASEYEGGHDLIEVFIVDGVEVIQV